MDQGKLKECRVLCVDDDKHLLDHISVILNMIGISQVTTVETATKALAIISENLNAFDVILCDLHMPDIDGMHLMSDLRRIGFKGNVGIISGAGEMFLEISARFCDAQQLNILGAIDKPVTVETLQHLLEGRT